MNFVNGLLRLVNVGHLGRAILITITMCLNDDELLLRRTNGKLKFFFFLSVFVVLVLKVCDFHFILLNFFICKLINLLLYFFLIHFLSIYFKRVLVRQNNIFLASFIEFNNVVICVFLFLISFRFFILVFVCPVVEHDSNVTNLFKLDNHILYQNLVTSKINSIFDIFVGMFSNDVIRIKELLFNILFLIFECLVIFLL